MMIARSMYANALEPDDLRKNWQMSAVWPRTVNGAQDR